MEYLVYNQGNSKYKRYMTVPVELCFYAQRFNRQTEVAIYLYLKWLFDGTFDINGNTFQRIKEGLGIKSDKTIRKYLMILLKKRWIIPKKGKYRAQGINYLVKTLGFTRKKRAKIYPGDFNKYKSFIAGTVITYLMKNKYQWDNKGASSSNSTVGKYKYNLPYRYLARKFFEIPESTARHIIRTAKKGGYILWNEEKRDLTKRIPSEHFWEDMPGYERKVPQRKIITRNGKKYEQLPTTYKSSIRLK